MNDAGTVKTVCMDADEIERSLTRIAHQILETNKGAGNIALVGIVTRGDLLAKRLAEKIEAIEGTKVPLGKLDISFYRDDFATHLSPEVHSTDILFDLDGKDVVLVDDVLYTGRTIRADFVGKNVPSSSDENVRLFLEEADGKSEVEILEIAPGSRAGSAPLGGE